ncbi:hypothetical protein G6L09_08125 [Agrobacterium rhizogenes]|nr:hypothetical protein [Rhizobium rhizogenes]NTH70523.1 hypothetical protein [Rhizobium rhizogenes]NTJ00291.1 hypothetical protein [Rhizobium rhizogenes]
MRQDRLNELLAQRLREHLSTRKPARVPEPGRLLWRWFCDLNAGRTVGVNGPDPIRNSEIEAYGRLHGWLFRQHHIEAIRRLDDAFLEHAYTARKTPGAGVKTLPPRSEYAITAGLIDAMFG